MIGTVSVRLTRKSGYSSTIIPPLQRVQLRVPLTFSRTADRDRARRKEPTFQVSLLKRDIIRSIGEHVSVCG